MFEKLLHPIILIFCLPLARADVDLRQHEHSFYSPNGEDGILIEIFKWIKPTQKFCIELGANDGISNSLTYMLRHQGWSALLLDKSFSIPVLDLHNEFITAENVNALFEKYRIPHIFDLLVINIGYNDFYIWHALEEKYKPSVVCIGYNSTFPTTKDQVVIYYPFFCGDDTHYYGASMLALYHLGRSKGYALVHAEEEGDHLFFIREEVLATCGKQFASTNDLSTLSLNVKIKNLSADKNAVIKNRRYTSSAIILQATPHDD